MQVVQSQPNKQIWRVETGNKFAHATPQFFIKREISKYFMVD